MSGPTMRAIAATAWGDVHVLHEVHVPRPTASNPHDIVVRVKATSVNPVDWKIRKGNLGPRPFPAVLGYDVAGIVTEVGSAVTQFKVGDEVLGGPSVFATGADAEYVAFDSRRAVKKPASMPWDEAAALPLVFLTAFDELLEAAPAAGKWCLVQAGGGGVGHICVQLAKKRDGMKVIATASSEATIALCKECGADYVINYKTEDVVKRVMEITNGAGADIVLDNVGGATVESSLKSAAARGHVSLIAGAQIDKFSWDPLTLRSITVHYVFKDTTVLFPEHPATRLESDGAAMQQAVSLYEKGLLKVHVSKRFPFTADGLRGAHSAVESGRSVGKVVVMHE